MNPQGHNYAGGSEMRFFTTGAVDASPIRDAVTLQGVQAVLRESSRQPLLVKIQHVYAEPVDVLLKVGDLPPVAARLQYGEQTIPLQLPASDSIAWSHWKCRSTVKPYYSSRVLCRPFVIGNCTSCPIPTSILATPTSRRKWSRCSGILAERDRDCSQYG